MSDYWLNKLFFDLQQPELGAQYKKDREAVLARYPLRAELRRAMLEDDLAALAPHVNAYLLRFYFAIRGMKDAEFIKRLNELPAKTNPNSECHIMADLVGVFAASHGPMIAREWDTLSPPTRVLVEQGFGRVGQRLAMTRPDVLVIVSPDHWCNFFLNNFPAFCVGIGEEHDGAPEPFLKKFFNHPVLAGHAGLGRHILDTALERDFDPSLSHRLTLDHGFCLPLWRMGLDPIPPIVPIVVNEVDAPMPTMRRCLAWGSMLRAAIESYPQDLRVAVLATGGLSHFIGEPGMGQIDEAFDRTCISLFENGDPAALASTLEHDVRHTGNGGHEVRNWVVAHAAAGAQGFELIGYAPLEEIYVGCAFAEWRLPA